MQTNIPDSINEDFVNRTKYLKEVIDFVSEKFEGKVKHFERTVDYLLHLYPKADDAMILAAYSHDIERAMNPDASSRTAFPEGDALIKHQTEGGRIMKEFLLSIGAPAETADKVCELISKHEEGGTLDQNIIKDADSLSYFEVNAPKHVNFITERGFKKEDIKDKFDWMYNRITSDEAKQIALPMYKQALLDLEKI